jgi:hypothetical protein
MRVYSSMSRAAIEISAAFRIGGGAGVLWLLKDPDSQQSVPAREKDEQNSLNDHCSGSSIVMN